MSDHLIIPKNIERYIRRLIIEYKNQNANLFDLLKNSEVKINNQDYIYDSYSRTYGHNLRVFLSAECFENKLSLKNQDKFSKKLKVDLNKTISVSNEYINDVIFELKDKIDFNLYLQNKLSINLKELSFWDKDCLRVFISYSEENLETANKLKKYLLDSSISCFVARKNIKSEKYKKEIIKALSSMELMIPLISESFNRSCWTNQEVGFAWCRGTTIIPIKLDQSDPMGFISGINAIVELNKDNVDPNSEGYLKLLDWIKDKFPKHPSVRKNLLKKFLDAKNGNYTWAKEKFMDIINFEFDDQEIEKIVAAIIGPARRSINQLGILLIDSINPEHLNQLPNRQYEYYAELLEARILSQHTQKRYSIQKLKWPHNTVHFKIIDNHIGVTRDKKMVNKQKFEELPF